VREPTREERAAMWLYHGEYARSGLGAIEFWKGLSGYAKRNVERMVEEILKAKPARKTP